MIQLTGIRPGDVGLTDGGGVAGWATRHGTGSNWGHAFVWHSLKKFEVRDGRLGELWNTVEAWPDLSHPKLDGVRRRERWVPTESTPAEAQALTVLRVGHTRAKRAAIVQRSNTWVVTATGRPRNVRYGWGEIVRIVLHMVGINPPRRRDNPNRAICSNHTTDCVLAGRPDLAPLFPLPASETWPGLLADVLLGAPGVELVSLPIAGVTARKLAEGRAA